MSSKKTEKKIKLSITSILVLFICLCVTTSAIMLSKLEIADNYYQTGTVEINLNDGEPVIKIDEYQFEPGVTVKKEFFIENIGTADFYYRLYFEEVEGGLTDIIDIKVMNGDKLLYEGKASELINKPFSSVDDELKSGEKRILDIYFHYPEEEGLRGMNEVLEFNLRADAVQTKNNSSKEFE